MSTSLLLLVRFHDMYDSLPYTVYDYNLMKIDVGRVLPIPNAPKVAVSRWIGKVGLQLPGWAAIKVTVMYKQLIGNFLIVSDCTDPDYAGSVTKFNTNLSIRV